MDLNPRGSSATLDVVLFVLLVGAAVTVLGGALPANPGTDRVAEETGDVLTTATTTVNFSRSGALRGGERITVERRAHGTYGELLAAATVADPAISGDGLTDSGASLTASVRESTRRVLGTRAANVEVVAIWRPYPGSVLRDETVVGDGPPRDASVALAAVSVGSGFPNLTSQAVVAASEAGFAGVARVAADAVIRGLFPRNPTDDALHSEGPDRAIVLDRYRHAASALDADVSGAVREGDFRRANRELAAALAARLRVDLRRAYGSPTEAARALRVHRVRIVVRTWSP